MTPKVISIGNISMGGTGKTPFAIKCANYFLSKGYKVCILSRGYKGKAGYGTNILSDGKEIFMTPPEAADEPYMIAQNCPGAIVITGKERKDSYSLAMEKFNPDIFILDDGFQHKRMPRDVDVLLMDHRRPVSTGMVFPFGYLREFPMAISRADIIVFTRAADTFVPKRVVDFVEDKPVFYSHVEFAGLIFGDRKMSLEEIRGMQVFAFAGLANSGKFFNYLRALGMDVIGKRNFMDHHTYTPTEIQKLKNMSDYRHAQLLVTSEKDYVKIPESMRKNVAYVKINVALNDEAGFFDTILEKSGMLETEQN